MVSEIAQYMLECEARYWVGQKKRHGFAWWNARKDKIRKIRGDKALERLLTEIKKWE